MQDLIRIGDKLVSRHKIGEAVDRILELRLHGHSQQEVAERLHLDRTFISRLETLGEVRKGGTIALVGFPILNKTQLEQVAEAEGVDFTLLMTEQERTEFVGQRSGPQLLNDLMQLVEQVRQHDGVILLGSDKRLRFLQALLDRDVVAVQIGKSPLKADVHVDPERVRRLIRELKRDAEGASR